MTLDWWCRFDLLCYNCRRVPGGPKSFLYRGGNVLLGLTEINIESNWPPAAAATSGTCRRMSRPSSPLFPAPMAPVMRLPISSGEISPEISDAGCRTLKFLAQNFDAGCRTFQLKFQLNFFAHAELQISAEICDAEHFSSNFSWNFLLMPNFKFQLKFFSWNFSLMPNVIFFIGYLYTYLSSALTCFLSSLLSYIVFSFSFFSFVFHLIN